MNAANEPVPIVGIFASGRRAAVPSDMRWMLLLGFLFVVSVYVTLPAKGEVPPVKMTCQLSEDIAEAAETRMIYLEGVYDKVTSVIEKTTLTVEINALWELKINTLGWQGKNCRK